MRASPSWSWLGVAFTSACFARKCHLGVSGFNAIGAAQWGGR